MSQPVRQPVQPDGLGVIGGNTFATMQAASLQVDLLKSIGKTILGKQLLPHRRLRLDIAQRQCFAQQRLQQCSRDRHA